MNATDKTSSPGQRLAGAIATALAILAAPVAAPAMTVQPVVMDLRPSGQGASQVITVDNSSGAAMPIEVKVEQITFGPGETQSIKPSEDIAAFPIQAVIPPGRSQAIRVQWVGPADLDASRSYYVTVSQLPVRLPAGKSGVEVVYSFQVLASVAPAGVKPKIDIVSSEVGRSAAGKAAPVVVVRNDSVAHGYLVAGNLMVTERDAAGKVLLQKTLSGADIQQSIGFGLVAPGQQRRVTLPVDLPAEDGRVEVRFVPTSR